MKRLVPVVVAFAMAATVSACSSSSPTTSSSSPGSSSTTGTPSGSSMAGESSSHASSASPTSADNRHITIAYAGVTEAVPLYKALGDGLATVTDNKGDKLLRFDNKLDPTVGMSNARLMVQQKPDIIIDWSGAGNNDAVGGVFSKAKIPCIAVNFPIKGCHLFNLDQGGTGGQLGAAVAPVVKSKGWTAANTTVLLVGATSAGIGPVQNVGGFYAGFAKAFPDMDQRSVSDFTLSTTAIGKSGLLIDGVGTVDGAYAATTRALQTVDKAKHLVVDVLADGMAPGVLRALQQAGRSNDMVFASTGADNAALKGLRSNANWVAEGDLGLSEWPAYLVAMASAVLDHAQVPALTSTPYRVLTKDNVNKIYTGNTATTKLPVPEADRYLLRYGLKS